MAAPNVANLELNGGSVGRQVLPIDKECGGLGGHTCNIEPNGIAGGYLCRILIAARGIWLLWALVQNLVGHTLATRAYEKWARKAGEGWVGGYFHLYCIGTAARLVAGGSD